MIRKTAMAPCGHRHRVVPAGKYRPATLRERLAGRRPLWAFGCGRARFPLNRAARKVEARFAAKLSLGDWEWGSC